MTEPVLNAPSFEFYEFFPKDFFDSKKRESEKGYEKFTKFVVEQLLPTGEWTRGDATQKEPDYLYNNICFLPEYFSELCFSLLLSLNTLYYSC